MTFGSETRRRVERGRRIVARQRKLVAKAAGRLPMAVLLLEEYERSLALLEASLPNLPRQAAMSPGTSPPPDSANQSSDLVLVLEVLREAGYRCELLHGTLH